jgi:hypothetical protein
LIYQHEDKDDAGAERQKPTPEIEPLQDARREGFGAGGKVGEHNIAYKAVKRALLVL